jgi:hypothetical protein
MGLRFVGVARSSGALNFRCLRFWSVSVYAIHFRAELLLLATIGIYFSSINLRVTRSIASSSSTLLLISQLCAEVSAPLSESERNHNNIRPK